MLPVWLCISPEVKCKTGCSLVKYFTARKRIAPAWALLPIMHHAVLGCLVDPESVLSMMADLHNLQHVAASCKTRIPLLI